MKKWLIPGLAQGRQKTGLEHLLCACKLRKKILKRMIEMCQQNTEVSLKINPTGQIKDNLSNKIMIIKNYNPLSKTGNHELALIHIN